MEAMMEYTIHLFNAGGFVMYPLVLFMLAACTILMLTISSAPVFQALLVSF